MKHVRAALSAVLIIAAQAAAPGEGRPQFATSMVSRVDDGAEPTISYAPNGTVWIGGMNVSGTQGTLWYANNDTSSFQRETDPPTYGGVDATVHHDPNGRLFWAELDGDVLRVAVRGGGTVWHQTDFLKGDRPWFRTNSSGVTYLAFANFTTLNSPVVELWKNASEVVGWTAINGSSNPVNQSSSVMDFTLHEDSFYLLLRDEVNKKLYVAFKGPSATAWSFTKNFSATDHALFGMPRLDLDSAGNIFIVYGESENDENSMWLTRYLPASNDWTSQVLLGTSGNTTAFAGVVAGAQGKLGVVWYTTPDGATPDAVADTAVWTTEYVLVTNAHASPTIAHRVLVANDTHVGKIIKSTSDWLGDFASISIRQGDSAGKVSLAFACDDSDGSLRCIPTPGGSPRLPAFAV